VKHVSTVAWRELRSRFVSPVAYVVLSLFAGARGLFFVLGVAGQPVRDPLQEMQSLDRLEQVNLSITWWRSLRLRGVIFLIAVPRITMDCSHPEKTTARRSSATSPLTIWDVVLASSRGRVLSRSWSRWSLLFRGSCSCTATRGGKTGVG